MAILAKTKMTLVERAESIAKKGGMVAALDPDDVNELIYSIERMVSTYIPQLQSQVLEFPSEWKISASRQQALMATAVGVGEMAGPNPSNAERTLRMAMRLDSTLPEPRFFLGLLYLWRNAACENGGSFGGLEKSLEVLSFVEEISDNERSLNEEARIMTGMYYVLKGDHENNSDLIDKGIKIYESELVVSKCNNEQPHPQVLARMAMAYQLRSNPRKSFELLIKALEIDPNYVRCKNVLVWDSIRIKGDIKEELTLKPIVDFFESEEVALLNLEKWTKELREHPFTSVSACISSTVMESLYILGDVEGAKEMAVKCLNLLRSNDPNRKVISPRAEAILAGRAPHQVP
jgi:tetratricopeptide (TPR) repeat protein